MSERETLDQVVLWALRNEYGGEPPLELTDDITQRGDSLDFVEAIIAVEEETGCAIPDEEAAHLRTGQEIVEWLSSNFPARAPRRCPNHATIGGAVTVDRCVLAEGHPGACRYASSEDNACPAP